MKFDKEEYLKNNSMLTDANILKNEEHEEVHTKRLHVVITDDETGELETEFTTNCMFLTALNAENTSESYNLTFTAAHIIDIAKIINTVENNINLTKKSYPQLGAACALYSILNSRGEGEEE